MTARHPTRPYFLILIAGTAIIAGCVARLYDVERMVVWHDEVYSLLRSVGFETSAVHRVVFNGQDLHPSDLLAYQKPTPTHGWGDTLASLMTHPEHSPAFYLAARLAAPVFQSPLAGIRGISAMLSLLLIPAIYWLAQELFKDFNAAWIAAALVACSPMHLLYAQEARQYALWTVLATAASASLLHALRIEGRHNWAVYSCLVAIRSGFVVLLGAGIWSGALILRADTWWSKNFSAENRTVAELVNRAERPLLMVTDTGVGLGEAISLAYYLEEKVVIRGEPCSSEGVSIAGFSDVLLVTPSAELRAALADDYELVPLAGTWQWFQAVPKLPMASV